MKIISAADLSFVAAGHEDPQSPSVWKKVLLKRDEVQDGKVQMVNWALLPVGKTFSPHYHEDMQELFVIIRGETRITVEGDTAVLKRGDAVLIDPHEVHEMSNIGDEDVEYIALGISAGTGGRTIVVEESDS